MSTAPTSLPSGADTELALSIERAYREIIVVDRLAGLWAVILSKCLLAQWAINEFSIPVSGLRYIWLLTLTMAIVATGLYLRAHRSQINFLPNQLRVGTAIFVGVLISIGFILYAHFALKLFSLITASALICTLLGSWSLARSALRNAYPLLIGALIWWVVAGYAFLSKDNCSLLWLGIGMLFAQALPSFALAHRTEKALRV
jgi:hypothetical protein